MISFDLETYRFGPSNLAPKPVCLSVAFGGGKADLIAAHDPAFDRTLEEMFGGTETIVTANGCYDAAVLLQHRPHLSSLIWDAYRFDRMTDIQIRERLLVLADTGDLDYAYTQGGAKMAIGYSQADLEKKYLGVDRSEEKNSEDSWRTNFSTFDGIPISEYPKEAYDYALLDAVYCLQIADRQEERSSLLKAQFLNTRASLALYLSSCWGFPVNQQRAQALLAEMSERFQDSNFPNMLKLGVLRAAEKSRPYATQLKKIQGPWEGREDELKAQGIKFTEPKPSSINKGLLQALVEQTSKEFDIPVKLTETGQVSTDAEVMTELKGLDVTIDEYIERSEIQKLVTAELPRIVTSDRVHPRYDVLKKTSRTSCRGNSKKDKNPAYPATNIQQVDPRARPCFVAAEGNVLCSVDYSAIELVSAAQKCVSLFGSSILADKIRAGMDPHAYLAAQLAGNLGDFPLSGDADLDYRNFKDLEKARSTYYAEWRGLAKPTGLGFPGGLGARRFVGYAKSTYGVDMIARYGSLESAIEVAKKLKELWMATFPEFRAYFEWVKRDCKDIEWSAADDQRYQYVSPFGTVRRNCHFTEATNGAALQTPTAEGAKIALFELARKAYDARLQSPLFGTHMVAFIHDEVIFEMPYDEHVTVRSQEISKTLVEGMSVIMRDVPVKTEAALMFEWHKEAKPTYDNQKRLIPWLPPSPSK